MDAGTFLSVALTAIAFLLALLGVAIAVRRCTRAAILRRRAAREAVLRPLLLRALSDDDPDLSVLQLDARAAKVMESLVWSMLTKVRGSSRTALVEWLTERGAVEKARARTHRAGAVGRASAAERLGAAAVVSTSPDVTRLLHDRHPEVRVVAVRSLGKLGDADAVPALLATLDGPQSVPTGLVSMALLHIGPSAIDNLVDGLVDPSDLVRMVCADLLGMHGAIQAARLLAELVRADASPAVRSAAAGALGRIGVPQSVVVLSEAMAPSSPSKLRVASASALGRIGGRQAIESLHVALTDGDGAVGAAAAEALAHVGGQGRHVLEVVAADVASTGHHRAVDWLARVTIDDDGRRTRRRDVVTTHDGGPSA